MAMLNNKRVYEHEQKKYHFHDDFDSTFFLVESSQVAKQKVCGFSAAMGSFFKGNQW